MRIAENAYAIGPSLHDWEREREDLEDMKHEARENAFNKDFYWWQVNIYCDRERDKEKILETMNIVMSNIYCNNKECADFEHALFTWYCSSDNREAKNVMSDLLDKHIRAVIRQEWEREQAE